MKATAKQFGFNESRQRHAGREGEYIKLNRICHSMIPPIYTLSPLLLKLQILFFGWNRFSSTELRIHWISEKRGGLAGLTFFIFLAFLLPQCRFLLNFVRFSKFPKSIAIQYRTKWRRHHHCVWFGLDERTSGKLPPRISDLRLEKARRDQKILQFLQLVCPAIRSIFGVKKLVSSWFPKEKKTWIFKILLFA